MLEGGGSGISTGASVGNVIAKNVRPTSTKKRKTNSYASRRSSSSSRRSSGGGGGGYSSGGGGGGGGGYSAPKSPTLSQYLGMDSGYQSAVKGSKRSLNDFLSEMERRKGEAGTQYTQTRGSMERDRETQLNSLRDEFASRGLIQSGLYGEEQGNFQKKFTEQMTALQQQQAALMADLLGQTNNFKRENDLSLEQAKQEALLRRAQKYS